MTVDIGAAIEDGLKRVWSKDAGILAGLFFVVGLLSQVGADTLLSGLEPMMSEPVGSTPMALGSSIGLGGFIGAVAAVASLALAAVAMRTLVSKAGESIPEEYYKRNMLYVVANMLVGGIVFGVAVMAGLFLLIIPGLFILTALYFYTFEIAVNDKSFIEAMKTSWSLTEGNRLRLFALGAIVGIGSGAVSMLVTAPLTLLEFGGTMALLSITLSNVVSSVVGVATLGIAAAAYNQLLELE